MICVAVKQLIGKWSQKAKLFLGHLRKWKKAELKNFKKAEIFLAILVNVEKNHALMLFKWEIEFEKIKFIMMCIIGNSYLGFNYSNKISVEKRK
jgi:hypothetical protein